MHITKVFKMINFTYSATIIVFIILLVDISFTLKSILNGRGLPVRAQHLSPCLCKWNSIKTCGENNFFERIIVNAILINLYLLTLQLFSPILVSIFVKCWWWFLKINYTETDAQRVKWGAYNFSIMMIEYWNRISILSSILLPFSLNSIMLWGDIGAQNDGESEKDSNPTSDDESEKDSNPASDDECENDPRFENDENCGNLSPSYDQGRELLGEDLRFHRTRQRTISFHMLK